MVTRWVQHADRLAEGVDDDQHRCLVSDLGLQPTKLLKIGLGYFGMAATCSHAFAVAQGLVCFQPAKAALRARDAHCSVGTAAKPRMPGSRHFEDVQEPCVACWETFGMA